MLVSVIPLAIIKSPIATNFVRGDMLLDAFHKLTTGFACAHATFIRFTLGVPQSEFKIFALRPLIMSIACEFFGRTTGTLFVTWDGAACQIGVGKIMGMNVLGFSRFETVCVNTTTDTKNTSTFTFNHILKKNYNASSIH